jgi:hypothetical protein
MLELARQLQSINPTLQGFLQEENRRFAEREEAAGVQAEARVDPRIALQENRDGWNGLIERQRRYDEENGTSYADELAAASPHFQRGLLRQRVNRLGMGLNDYLMAQYRQSPPSGDAGAVQQWINQQTAAYQAQFGMEQLDPVLLTETFTPYANQAIDSMASYHTQQQLRGRSVDYRDELSAGIGMLLNEDPEGETPAEEFASVFSAARGEFSIQTGVSEESLTAYNAMNGTSYTAEDVAGMPFGGELVGAAAIAVVDETINARGYTDMSYSRNGLRAVALEHGTEAMHRYVAAGPEAQSEYPEASATYTSYTTNAPRMQAMLDSVISNGMAPRQANETVVQAVIGAALDSLDPSMLDVLDQLTTGNGPLGNIGWVREDRANAEDRILDRLWERDRRQHTLEEQAREEAGRLALQDGLTTLMSDPSADIEDFVTAARNAGNPGAATTLLALQETMLDRQVNVRTDPDVYTDLRLQVGRAASDGDYSAVEQAIATAAANELLAPSDVGGLMDDLASRQRNSGYFGDRDVVRYFDNVENIISDRFGVRDLSGSVSGGEEVGLTARQLMQDEAYAFLDANPEVSQRAFRLHMRGVQNEILNSVEFQPPEGMFGGVASTAVGQIPGRTVPEFEPTPEPAPAPAPAPATNPSGMVNGQYGNIHQSHIDFMSTPAGLRTLQLIAQELGITPAEYAAEYNIPLEGLIIND